MNRRNGVPWRRQLATSPLGRQLGFLLRVRLVLQNLGRVAMTSARWLGASRETTNFNYDLTALNRLHLAWWVAEATGVGVGNVLSYFDELENDEELREHVRLVTSRSAYCGISDEEVRYGRRLAWYALVRVLRPEHVLETGIDKGLGTVVLAAAVRRNGSGHVTGVDVVHDAGWLVGGPYSEWVNVLVGDAASAIASSDTPIDVLVHDVHFTAEQEASEYRAVIKALGRRPVILNDNAHSHRVLPDLAAQLGWHFSVFHEVSRDHWYPGAAMALAWPP